jgi:hypothetical protein
VLQINILMWPMREMIRGQLFKSFAESYVAFRGWLCI